MYSYLKDVEKKSELDDDEISSIADAYKKWKSCIENKHDFICYVIKESVTDKLNRQAMLKMYQSKDKFTADELMDATKKMRDELLESYLPKDDN